MSDLVDWLVEPIPASRWFILAQAAFWGGAAYLTLTRRTR